jgi:hypothetical protein
VNINRLIVQTHIFSSTKSASHVLMGHVSTSVNYITLDYGLVGHAIHLAFNFYVTISTSTNNTQQSKKFVMKYK